MARQRLTFPVYAFPSALFFGSGGAQGYLPFPSRTIRAAPFLDRCQTGRIYARHRRGRVHRFNRCVLRVAFSDNPANNGCIFSPMSFGDMVTFCILFQCGCSNNYRLGGCDMPIRVREVMVGQILSVYDGCVGTILRIVCILFVHQCTKMRRK